MTRQLTADQRASVIATVHRELSSTAADLGVPVVPARGPTPEQRRLVASIYLRTGIELALADPDAARAWVAADSAALLPELRAERRTVVAAKVQRIVAAGRKRERRAPEAAA